MAGEPASIELILELLAGAPPRIAEATAGLTPVQLRTAPNPGEWSINDILAHLRACGDTWGGCIDRILTEENPTIRAIDPRSWMAKTDYPDLEFKPSFATYTRQRTDLVTVLQALTPTDWRRSAIITGAGAKLVRTVAYYAEWLPAHERSHLKQIGRIAAALRA